jgi:hypothetical protein
MTLSFQNIPTQFIGAGLDTKSHPTAVPTPKLTTCENVVFTQTGALNKRAGYKTYPKTILGAGANIQTGLGTAVYGSSITNQELLLFDGSSALSWSPNDQRWISRGDMTSVKAEYFPIIQNTYKQTNPDVCGNSKVELYAWEDTRSTAVRYSIFDVISQSYIVADYVLATNASRPRCVNFNGALIILYIDNNTQRLHAATISASNPTNPTDEVIISDIHYQDLAFDVVTSGNYLYLLYGNADRQGQIIKYGSNFRTLASFSSNDLPCWKTCTLALANDILYFAAADHPSSYVWDVVVGSITADMNTYDGYHRLTGIEPNHMTLAQQSGTENARLYFDTGSANTACVYVADITRDAAYGADVFKRSVSLGSKAFNWNGLMYVNVIHDSPLQPTQYLINENGTIVSKSHLNSSGGALSRTLSGVLQSYSYKNLLAGSLPEAVFIWASERRSRIVSNGNTIYALTGIARTSVNFQSTPYQYSLLSGSLHLCGGILQAYDGKAFYEHGFHLFPEHITFSANGEDGYLLPGIYSYMVCYEWTDNQGKIERSAPSPPITVDITDSIYDFDTNVITLTIPTLRLTVKADVRIVIYRTRAASSGDPLYYRISSIVSPLMNDMDADTVVFYDGADYADARADISANDVLYCSPDSNGSLIEVENICAPNCSLTCTYKNRVFLAGLEDANQIWFSKTVVPGEPAAFNDSFVIQLDPSGGPITGLAVMDSSLVIFKHSRIYALSGIGPTNTGDQNDFNDPQMIASDIGCISAPSIVLYRDGLLFQSAQGIYHLDRSFSCTYLGAPVEKYNKLVVTGSSNVPDTTMILFTTASGTALLYDHYFQQWATWTNHKAIHVGTWNNLLYYINNIGTIYQQTPGVYSDNGANIPLKIETGWLSFAGINGFQRLRDFVISGDYYGPHKLSVKVYLDNNKNWATEAFIETSRDTNTYGENDVFGENGIYGGSFAAEQFRIFPKNPRCSNILVSITDLETDPNRGLSLVGLTFRVGVKSGIAKLPTSRQAGTK